MCCSIAAASKKGVSVFPSYIYASAQSSLVSPSNSIRFLYFKLRGSKRGLSRGPVLTTLIRRGPSACWKVYGADNELSNDNFWTDAGPHYFDLTASQCQLKEDLYHHIASAAAHMAAVTGQGRHEQLWWPQHQLGTRGSPSTHQHTSQTLSKGISLFCM